MTVAQGYWVFEATKSPAKLALITFVRSLPYFFMGPVPGVFVDRFNKKTLLVITQLGLASSSLYLAIGTHFHFVQYWHVVICALVVGTTGAFEIPARQSAVGSVVPPEDLGAAIPLNALTFNFARLLGPAIGGIILAKVGVDACYLTDGLSYFALIFAALAIRADLRAEKKDESQGITDMVLEGARYTFRERPLRTLFILELIVSTCGIFYIALIPAIAEKMLFLGKNLGYCYVAMAFGTISSLLVIAATSDSGKRALVLRYDMTLMAVGLLLLSFTHTRITAYAVLALLGACGVAHFNITNTMFQLLSPLALRGRVLSMHVWALSGLGPFGTMFFGWMAERTSLAITLQAGAACMAVGAIGAWMSKRGLQAV